MKKMYFRYFTGVFQQFYRKYHIHLKYYLLMMGAI